MQFNHRWTQMNTDKNQTGLLDGWMNGLVDAGVFADNPTILCLICVHLWLRFFNYIYVRLPF